MLFSWTRCSALVAVVASYVLPASLAGVDSIKLVPAFPNLAFERPVAVMQVDDGSKRFFVVEQPSRIINFAGGPDATETTVFLDHTLVVDTTGYEQGLLSLEGHRQRSHILGSARICFLTASLPRPSKTVSHGEAGYL